MTEGSLCTSHLLLDYILHVFFNHFSLFFFFHLLGAGDIVVWRSQRHWTSWPHPILRGPEQGRQCTDYLRPEPNLSEPRHEHCIHWWGGARVKKKKSKETRDRERRGENNVIYYRLSQSFFLPIWVLHSHDTSTYVCVCVLKCDRLSCVCVCTCACTITSVLNPTHF